jgi:tetratricopeptide (TPR) repeat protein
MRDFEDATRYTVSAFELEREAAFPQWIRSLLLSHQGQHGAAITTAESAAVVGDRQPLLLAGLGAAYARAGRSADAEAVLQELERLSATDYVAPIWLGDVCVALGRLEQALDYFERGFEQQVGFLHRIGSSPEHDPLRDHPRFKSLLRRLNLPVS